MQESAPDGPLSLLKNRQPNLAFLSGRPTSSSDLALSRSSSVQRLFFCGDVIAITSWAPDVNLVRPIALGTLQQPVTLSFSPRLWATCTLREPPPGWLCPIGFKPGVGDAESFEPSDETKKLLVQASQLDWSQVRQLAPMPRYKYIYILASYPGSSPCRKAGREPGRTDHVHL